VAPQVSGIDIGPSLGLDAVTHGGAVSGQINSSFVPAWAEDTFFNFYNGLCRLPQTLTKR